MPEHKYTMKMGYRQTDTPTTFRNDSYAAQYNYAMRNEHTKIVGGYGGARKVRPIGDEADDRVMYTYQYDKDNIEVKNFLGGRGNRAETVPTFDFLSSNSFKGKGNKGAYDKAVAFTRDSLNLVNQGKGILAQQKYGPKFGKSFLEASEKGSGAVEALIATTQNKGKRGVNPTSPIDRGSTTTAVHSQQTQNTPYLRANPNQKKKKGSTEVDFSKNYYNISGSKNFKNLDYKF
jgi:hypothetical protein